MLALIYLIRIIFYVRINKILLILILLPALDRSLASVHDPLKPFGLKNYFNYPGDTSGTDDSADDDNIKERTFAIGLEACNDQEHYGLRDANQRLPFLEPSFTYTAKSGFYVELTDQYLLMKRGGGFDVFGWNPGWNIDLTDKTTLNVNWQGYRFRGKSVNFIGSSEADALSTYIEQDIGNLTGKFTAAYDIYKKPSNPKIPRTANDFVFTPDLTYNFEYDWGKTVKQSFAVIPEVSIDAGTANFITNYENLKVADSAANGLKTRLANYAANSNSKFELLDYSFTLSIDYNLGNFEMEPQFIYCIPIYKPLNRPSPKSAIISFTLTYNIRSKK